MMKRCCRRIRRNWPIIYKLLSKKEKIVGYDINKNLMNQTKFNKFNLFLHHFLHIAIPVNKNLILISFNYIKNLNQIVL